MFGAYRYGLALCVVFSHLYAGFPGGPAAYAVWGFFMLSGYLMALILNTRYGFTTEGLRVFAFNRAVRLLPAYYAVWIVAVAVFAMLPMTSSTYFPGMGLPRSVDGWLNSLFFYHPRSDGDVIHTAWAVRVELVFYVLMGLGLARGTSMALVWFGISVLIASWLVVTGADFEQRYGSIEGGSLAFSIGVLLFQMRDRFPQRLPVWMMVPIGMIWWLYVPMSYHWPMGGWSVLGLYGSLVPSAIAVIGLSVIDRKACPRWFAKTDEFLGDLSYPIYLVHWSTAIVASWLTGGKGRWSLSVLVIGFVLTHIASFAILELIEKPIRNRWKIKPKKPLIK